MDEDAYRDHLVDRAKALLAEQADEQDETAEDSGGANAGSERSESRDGWADWEIGVLIRRHRAEPVDALAGRLGRDVAAVEAKLAALGLADAAETGNPG